MTISFCVQGTQVEQIRLDSPRRDLDLCCTVWKRSESERWETADLNKDEVADVCVCGRNHKSPIGTLNVT